MWGKRNLYLPCVAMQTSTAGIEVTREVSLQIITQCYAIPALNSEESAFCGNICTYVFIPALVTILGKWNQTRYPSTDE